MEQQHDPTMFADTGLDRAIPYRIAAMLTGIPGTCLNILVIYFIVRHSPVVMAPYKYLLLNVTVHNLISVLVLCWLFQPVPFLSHLSVSSTGLANLVAERPGHAMLALTIFCQSQMIASVDLCAVFRFYSIRGTQDWKIVRQHRFIWDISVGWIYSISFALILYLNKDDVNKQLQELLSTSALSRTLCSFAVRPVLAYIGIALLAIGLLHSAGPNLFFVIYVLRKLKISVISNVEKEKIRRYMKAIMIQAFVPYISLSPPVFIFLLVYLISGFRSNLILQSDVTFLIILTIVMLWPSINAIATLYYVQPYREQFMITVFRKKRKLFVGRKVSVAVPPTTEPVEEI